MNVSPVAVPAAAKTVKAKTAVNRIDQVLGAVPENHRERQTFDAGNLPLPSFQNGKLVRDEASGPTGDDIIDAAHDNAGVVYDFYQQVLHRDSLDGKGMPMKSVTHWGRNFGNAYWDGRRMVYGDGDHEVGPLSKALDVVAHEMTHGVTEHTTDLAYSNQTGALNESWSDVMGELIEQWHTDPKGFQTPDGAKKANWLLGDTAMTPDLPGDAIRDLRNPGTAYDGDPQPAHMKDYVDLPDDPDNDNGGVHINSGIPNKAAVGVAESLGGEKTAQIWYRALDKYMGRDAVFSDAALATQKAAVDLFGKTEGNAVLDAWKAVGVNPGRDNPGVAPRPRGNGTNLGPIPPKLGGAPNPDRIPANQLVKK